MTALLEQAPAPPDVQFHIGQYEGPDFSQSNSLRNLHPKPEELDSALLAFWEAQKEQPVIELRQALYDVGDEETLQHSDRVALTAHIIGQRLGLTGEELRLVTLAGLVHDIGKAAPQIQQLVHLNRKLTPQEYKVMEAHPFIGAESILAVSGWDDEQRAAIAELTLAHHACKVNDPYGKLPSGNLLRPAKVLALADTSDGQASKRSYKEPFSETETRKALHEEFNAEPEFIDTALNPPGYRRFSRQQQVQT